ncbi:GABA permease [Acinetobacter stercoris]|uniref:GABA permease n=1 Tax=Acinetobacter stercoris TaxID=2126983 RepID=A0A2U3N466_9GAMM|nr:GABA permease [Acinetobacter stercoris]
MDNNKKSTANKSASLQVYKSQLADSLTKRQISMISIGGIIGAGLFVGSASGIAAVGPAIILSYVLTSILVFLVMRMLGEMAVIQPDTGSFSTYAASAIGPWAGFSIGWLYWWFWVLVIPIEAIAGADILAQYFAMPAWLFALLIVIFLTSVNLFNVKNYGEFEFWFALIKVIAIILFILVAGMAVLGWWPWANTEGISNLYQHGGFMPNGFGAILAGVLLTIFSFFGSEVVSIAAAEAKHPQEKIRKATNLVIYRIAIF